MVAARTGSPTSTSKLSLCAPTTRSAVHSAALAPTRPSSPWRASWTAWPRQSASAAGRSEIATSLDPATPGALDKSWTTAQRGRDCVSTRSSRFYDEAIAAGPAGLALGLKNSGLGNGFKEIIKAVVHFRDDGMVEVRHCWTEMGQGIHTVAQQIAITELDVPAHRIEVIVDSTRDLSAGQTTGSRGTQMGAGAVADACRKAVADGCRTGVDYEGEYRVDWTNALSEGLENPVIHSTFSYAAQLAVLDPESGDVDRMVAVHDVGKAVNPMLCEGQVEGSVHMGLGYALTEGFPCDEDGRPANTTFRSLDIIRPKDMPDVEVVLVEAPQPDAPYGIKGVGEIGLVPTAPAVAAALRAHDGEWRTELPMKNAKNRERASAWT